MILLEINDKFGLDLYGKLSNSLFYVVVIIAFMSVVTVAVKKDFKSVVGMIISFCIVLFMFSKPQTFLSVGDVCYKAVFDVLNGLNKGSGGSL